MSTKEPIWTKPFISLFLANMAVFIIFYSLIATLPLYATEQLYRTDGEAGLLVSIFLLAAIITRPFSGILLDITGKRKMLLISLLFYSVFTIVYFFIESFFALLILRFLQGMWFSVATTACGALAADHVPVTRRGTGLGYFAMSTNVAIVIGPMIGLFFFQTFTFKTLIIILTGLIVFGTLASLSIPADEKTETNKVARKLSLHDLIEKRALPVAFIAALFSVTYAGILSYLSIYAQQKGLLSLASTFFLVFAATMIITRPFTGRIFDEKGPIFLLIPAFLSYILGLILLGMMNSPWLFMLAAVFFGLGYGGTVPSLQTLAIQATARERSGYATATFFTCFDLGIAIGSYLLGLVASAFGYETMYFFSSAIIVLVIGLYMIHHRMMRKKENENVTSSS